MGNLPIWALWPITIAVWASPGLAILSARSIARLLHRVLWPRPKKAAHSRRSWHTDNRSSLQLRGDEQSDADRGSGVAAREGRATSRLRPLPLGSSMSRVDFLRQRALLTSLRGGTGHRPAFAVDDVVPRHAAPAIFRCDLVPSGVPAVMIAYEAADLFPYADNRCGV